MLVRRIPARLLRLLLLITALACTQASAAGVAEQVEAIEAKHGNAPQQVIERLAPLESAARVAGGRDLVTFLGAWGYAHGATNRASVADAAIAELREIGERSSDPMALAMAYALKATMLQFTGQLPAAAVWIDRAVPLARQAGNAPLQYWVLMSAGDLSLMLGQLDQALAQFQLAALAAQAHQNPRREAQARIAMLPLQIAAGRNDAALAESERALTLAVQAHELNLQLAVRVLEALAAEQAGLPERRLSARAAARALAASIGTPGASVDHGVNPQTGGPHWYSTELKARLDVAAMLLGAGKYRQALRMAEQAEHLARQQRDSKETATATLQRGLAMLGLGQREAGRELADIGLAQLRQSPESSGELLIWLHRYAQQLQNEGDAAGALQRTREALLLEAEKLRSDRLETVLELQRKSSAEEAGRQLDALKHENALQAAALKRRHSEVLLALAVLGALGIGTLLSLWLYARVLRANRQLRQHQAELEYATSHDRITALPNRSQLEADTLALQTTPGASFLGIGVSIKRFGLIVGSLGHELGDRLLVQIAARLQKVLEPRAGRVYRLDGLSFACLIEHDSGDADARMLLAALAEAMDCPFVLDQQELVVTINLGAAAFPRHADTAAGVARHIQLAVRDARAHPGNSYRLFDEVLAQHQREQLRLEAKLAQALERNELQLHYQPQRDLRSGALLGFEALLRWTTAEGPVSPAVFIPLAEDSGRIIEIGRWVLQQACRQARAWADAGLGLPVVAVNVSPRQFQHPGFLDSVREALHSSGADPAQIELEITEGAVMGDAESTIRTLHALRELGLQLAIDDFGTGYASLSYLRRFPLNRLKIDQSFIRPLGRSHEDRAIVEALIHLSHSLGLHVVAEGVETAEQQACLTELGCDAMQGYWFARPGPVETATALLLQQSRAPGSA